MVVGLYYLMKNFGSLKQLKDWTDLYKHLARIVFTGKGSTDIGLPPTGQTIMWTILLFQSICPIRFGFLDGLARMVSVGHYLLRAYPGDKNSEACIYPLSKLDQNSTTTWSVETTSKAAVFEIVFPDASVGIVEGTENSAELLEEDLRNISYSRYATMMAGERYHVSDAFNILITTIESMQSRQPSDPWGVLEFMDDYMKKIIFYLSQFVLGVDQYQFKAQKDNESTMEKLERIYIGIRPSTTLVCFPALARKHNSVANYKFEAFSYMVAAMCAREASRQALEELMNDNWRGRLSKTTMPMGKGWNTFHEGTYLNLTMEDDMTTEEEDLTTEEDEGPFPKHLGNYLYRVSKDV
jgi:hypothetical protein